MRGLWIALVWLIWVSVSPALAEVYRWTDDTGKVHLTDNPDTIPPAYRAWARASGSGTPATDETPSVKVRPSPPQPLPADRLPATQAPAPSATLTTPEIAELERQIAAARQERQTYLEQLSSEREVQATPVFVRQRRQIAELGVRPVDGGAAARYVAGCLGAGAAATASPARSASRTERCRPRQGRKRRDLLAAAYDSGT